MNASEQDRLARRIARRLDFGGLALDQRRRLAGARAAALSLAEGRGRPWWRLSGRTAAPLAGAVVATLLVAAVLLHREWLPPVESTPTRDVDYALLVDDLPIDAYLDEGFSEWLARRSES